MTDKEFVISIFPQAYSIYVTWLPMKGYVIWAVGWSKNVNNISDIHVLEIDAWKEAAVNIRLDILNKLEK